MRVRAVESAEEALSLLAHEEFFMVITDARLGRHERLRVPGQARHQWPELPILMITAYATPKLAVEAIKAGAIDYLAKPFAPEELLHAVARCAERYRLLQENARLRARAGETYRLDQSSVNRQRSGTAAADPDRGPTDARGADPGESGTGKELVAGALHSLEPAAAGHLRAHQLRGHSRKPSWKANCSAMRRAPSPARSSRSRAGGGSRRRHDFPRRDCAI